MTWKFVIGLDWRNLTNCNQNFHGHGIGRRLVSFMTLLISNPNFTRSDISRSSWKIFWHQKPHTLFPGTPQRKDILFTSICRPPPNNQPPGFATTSWPRKIFMVSKRRSTQVARDRSSKPSSWRRRFRWVWVVMGLE